MSMAQIKLGNLLWRPHTRPISPEDPVDVKDVNAADIKTKLEMVQSELALVKAELQEIKANQLSGDQKVQLKGSNMQLLFSQTDTFLRNRFIVYYGHFTRGTTDMRDLTPVDYRQHRLKTIYIVNNTNGAVHFSDVWGHVVVEKNAPRIIRIPISVMVDAGETGKISWLEYPDLADVLPGLTLVMHNTGVGLPAVTDGSLTLYWMGGN